MAGLTLNYGEQKNAVEGDRIPSSEPVDTWVAAAYTDIWNAAKWTFKKVRRETLYTSDDGTVTGTPTATPSMPTAFGEIHGFYDDSGAELAALSEAEFDQQFAADTSTGRPYCFTIVNRQIILGPTPDAAYQFSISYQRRLATRSDTTTVQAGFYQNDSDLPLWDDHHYILVVRAKIIGLKNLSDPTAGDLEGEFGRMLDAMKTDYVQGLPRGYQSPSWV